MQNAEQKTALIAMSGGVDSSIAAYLMRQADFRCMGTTMRLYRNEDLGACNFRTCCSEKDIEDASEVAFQLDIPYEVLDFAEQHGLYYVVTGHYARIEQDEQTGRWLLKKGVDAGKDQSYVLYTMTQRQLAHTKFPLGDRNKPEIRELAEQLSFCNARKHDSQDICFVPDGDYVKFMEQYTGKHYPAGDFLDLDGKPVGKHKGAVRYTVGQRRGLGLAMGEPVYVCGKDMEKNTVSVGPEAALFSDTVIVDDMNWISIPELTEPIHIKAKIRYRHAEQPVTVSPLEDGRVKLVFDEPQRAAAIGQAAVLYDGDVVVGGGTIVDVPKQAGK